MALTLLYMHENKSQLLSEPRSVPSCRAQRDTGEVWGASSRPGQPSPILGLMPYSSDSQSVYIGTLAISRNLLEMQILRHPPSPSLSLLIGPLC